MSTISRRQAITGAATVGVGVPLLAACGDDGSDPKADASDPATSSAPQPSTDAPSDTGAPTSDPPAGGGISTSDVPVGGGIVVVEESVVVTQPTEGEFKAFTAVCTHAGCLVARVSTEIECDCHGSRYSIEDGSVVGGPAPTPLGEFTVTVSGDQITVE
ncbi:Rieske (2Fe-2S) protein [Nocardioides stalactiti]|uniref:Rieske (2Fe-2S) protein n=1 Tax=Nocardioides stalactiti TaxID=2755356 RepID=UPI00160055EC|nr:Rieske (2Fe-2S) protein [Nocardioides stalactiti]